MDIADKNIKPAIYYGHGRRSAKSVSAEKVMPKQKRINGIEFVVCGIDEIEKFSLSQKNKGEA